MNGDSNKVATRKELFDYMRTQEWIPICHTNQFILSCFQARDDFFPTRFSFLPAEGWHQWRFWQQHFFHPSPSLPPSLSRYLPCAWHVSKRAGSWLWKCLDGVDGNTRATRVDGIVSVSKQTNFYVILWSENYRWHHPIGQMARYCQAPSSFMNYHGRKLYGKCNYGELKMASLFK